MLHYATDGYIIFVASIEHLKCMSIFNKLFGKKEGDGETPEFKALLEGSMEGLRLQTEAHQGTWRLGKSERRDFFFAGVGRVGVHVSGYGGSRTSADYRFV